MTRRGSEWKIDTGEKKSATEGSPLTPRFLNLAVRVLGYTHTEAGFRRLSQLQAELDDLALLAEEQKPAGGGLGWLEDEKEG